MNRYSSSIKRQPEMQEPTGDCELPCTSLAGPGGPSNLVVQARLARLEWDRPPKAC
jgi:hypothetical protein